MKSSIEVAILAVATITAGASHWVLQGRPSGLPEVELAETPLRSGEVRIGQLQEEGVEGILWVDARRREQWQRDGLEGSIHLSMLSEQSLEAQIEQHFQALATADRVVVYCDDLHCSLSHQLAEALRAIGLVPGEISVLQGGMTALRQAGMQ